MTKSSRLWLVLYVCTVHKTMQNMDCYEVHVLSGTFQYLTRRPLATFQYTILVISD